MLRSRIMQTTARWTTTACLYDGTSSGVDDGAAEQCVSLFPNTFNTRNPVCHLHLAHAAANTIQG